MNCNVNIYFESCDILQDLYLSAHGTYIGNIRLESKKPQQVPLDSEIHFGASTRIYVIRERPQPVGPGGLDEDGTKQSEKEGNLLGLPESETELDVSRWSAPKSRVVLNPTKMDQ